MISDNIMILDTSSSESSDDDPIAVDEKPSYKSKSVWNGSQKAKNIQAMLQTLSVDVEMSSVFICRVCGEAFKRKYDCNQHEATFHGELIDDEFPCRYCNRVFVSNEFLDRHVLETHSENEANEVLSLDENVTSSVDISNQLRKRPRMSNSNDKENAISQPSAYQKGYVISYLGKPRFLFPNTTSNVVNKNNGSISSQHKQSNVTTRDGQKSNELPLTHEKSRVLSGENKNTPKIKNNAVILNLEDLCRLCGSYNERTVSIFSTTRCNYLKMIQDYFPQIQVSQDDLLPTQICIKCETHLSTWYQFRKDCNAANIRFQAMLKMLMSEPDVKEQLAAKKRKEENRNSDDSDCERTDDDDDDVRTDDDAVEVPSKRETSGPTEVELVDVRPETSTRLPDIFADSSLTAQERRRVKQRMRARIRLHRLKQRPSSCPLCDKTFNLPETLRRHLSTVHSDEKPYKCTICSCSYNRNHYLTSHIKSVHLKQGSASRPAEPPHLCDYCGKALSSARSLQVHINCVHTKEQSYECDTCHVTFYQKISLQNHLGRNQCTTLPRGGKSVVRCEEGFPKACEICGLEFKTEIFYTKHQMKHMTSLTCPVCSVVLVDANALKEHLEIDHPEMTPFQCEICGKRFKTKNFLQKHAVIHGGEKKFECEYCSTKFLKKKYLINHVRRHTGERPFVCSICGRAFTQVSEMRIHKARHKLAKPT